MPVRGNPKAKKDRADGSLPAWTLSSFPGKFHPPGPVKLKIRADPRPPPNRVRPRHSRVSPQHKGRFPPAGMVKIEPARPHSWAVPSQRGLPPQPKRRERKMAERKMGRAEEGFAFQIHFPFPHFPFCHFPGAAFGRNQKDVRICGRSCCGRLYPPLPPTRQRDMGEPLR